MTLSALAPSVNTPRWVKLPLLVLMNMGTSPSSFPCRPCTRLVHLLCGLLGQTGGGGDGVGWAEGLPSDSTWTADRGSEAVPETLPGPKPGGQVRSKWPAWA